MSDPPNKIPEEVVNEVKTRLANDESPEDIADDDAMPSRRKIYDIKSEWEAAREQQKQIEKDVFNDTNTAGREELVEVLNEANIGVTQAGEPKAKVEKALSAIDFDSAWDDPHHVANELVEEANMKREWANRIVRKTYDMPDFPYVDRGPEDEHRGEPAPRSRGRGGDGTRSRRETRSQRDRRERTERDRGREQDPQTQQLQQQMQQLQSTVSDLAEVVSETVQEDDGQEADTVTVQRGEKEITVPTHVAISQGLLGERRKEEKDFMDKLREAKNAGIIPDPDDFQQDDSPDITEVAQQLQDLGVIGDDDGNEEMEMLAEMMDEMSEQFAEAQESVAAQMSAAIGQLADDSDSETEELTMEDLQEFWQQKEKEDKIDKLENELQQTREEIREEVKSSRRSSKSPDQDPEVVKQRDKLAHEKDQLEMVNDTLQTLPNQMTEAVRDGLLPLYKELQTGAAAGGNDLWTPPNEKEQHKPGYTPEEVQRQPRQQEPQREGYPEPDAEQDRRQEQQQKRERADNLREKLNIGDENGDEEAQA